MAIRFIDSSFYKSPFVRSLKGPLKSLYNYIICESTGAGIWAIDLQVASMYIGFTISDAQFQENFVSKGKAISIGNGRYFFPDFIEHQYPKGLSMKNPAHKNFILELNKYCLLDANLKVLVRTLEGPLKGLESPISNSNSNSNSKGNGVAGEKQPSHPLQIYCEKFKNVSSLKTQLNYLECFKLENKFQEEKIANMIMQMENKVDLNKKYASVYLTLNNWLKRELS